MFFMNAKALDEFVNASGFEVGVGPSVVLVDEGMAKTTTTSDAEGRHLRLRLRAEGTDGGPRHTGQQDHEDHAKVGTAASDHRRVRTER